MRLSTEQHFAQMAFPQLRKTGQEEHDDGYIHGHAAGYAAGLRAAEAERTRLLAQLETEFAARRAQQQAEAARLASLLRSAAEALNTRTVPTVADAEEALVAAAVDLAEAILGYELADRSKAARAALDRAVSGSKGLDAVAIRMNPQDIAALESGASDGVGPAVEPGRTAVVLTPDPSLDSGDAVVDLPRGFLDAKINTALARVKNALAVDRP